MIGIEQRLLCGGVNFRSIRDTKFKTVRISVHFMLPLEKQTVAANALLPFLMSRASRQYPDFTKLNQRLAELYGAVLNADVQKLGDVQVLSVSASGIADRYALEQERISEELSKLLCSVLFDPPFDADGLFPQDSVEQEKRQTIELIDSEYNDKRTYALRRCEQIMCEQEPSGISRYGGREEIKAVAREELSRAWERLLQTARVEIMVLGDCNASAAYEGFSQAFQQVRRTELADCTTKVVSKAEQVKEVSEKMDVAQSKLVLGFRTAQAIPSPQVPAVKLLSALYGGTPNSKLFLNVREKMSLCYYCSSSYNSMKGILYVQSGVETKNLEKAKEEILRQLEEIRSGNFTEDEIQAAKLYLKNAMNTLSDSLGGLENWYLSQVFSNRIESPQEAAALLGAVTREELVEAANQVTLDTVYRLEGKEEQSE